MEHAAPSRAHGPGPSLAVGISLIAVSLASKAIPWERFWAPGDPVVATLWFTFLGVALLQCALLVIGLVLVFERFQVAERVEDRALEYAGPFRIFVTLLVGAAVVQSVWFGYPDVRGSLPALAGYVVNGLYSLILVTTAIACVTALALGWRAAEQRDARALALFMAFLALFWGPVLSVFWLEYEPGSINFGSSFGGQNAGALTAFALSVAAFVRFSALFPRRLTASDLDSSKRPGPLRALRAKLLSPSTVWGVSIGLAIYFALPDRGQGADGSANADFPAWGVIWTVGLSVLLFGLPLLGMTAGAINLRASYVASSESERKKILWVVAGCVGGTGMVLSAVFGFFVGSIDILDWVGLLIVLLPLAPLMLVVCLALSVFYKGSIHPALVIKRTTVYGVLGVVLIAAASAAESLLSEVLADALGFSGLASAASLGAVIAIAVFPLRAPLGRLLGTWLPQVEGEAMTTDHAPG